METCALHFSVEPLSARTSPSSDSAAEDQGLLTGFTHWFLQEFVRKVPHRLVAREDPEMTPAE